MTNPKVYIDKKKETISICTSKGWITVPIDEEAFREVWRGYLEAKKEIGEEGVEDFTLE